MHRLMSIIEMMQFKDRLSREQVVFKDGYYPCGFPIISNSVHQNLTRHFLMIPDQCTRSIIVHPDSDRPHRMPRYKKMATGLYRKFVQKGGSHEIDVDETARAFLTDLMGNTRLWNLNKEYNDHSKL